MSLLRKICRLCICFMLMCVGIIVSVELWTSMRSTEYCHDSVSDCGHNRVAVVLGCSKYFSSGKPNSYFRGRMEAAAALWKSGRIRGIIVSGDNSDRYYNEPKDMRAALVKLGVPDEKIVSDFAGLRTYDSVVRTARIFNAGAVTFISQPDHVARAVAIARGLGMDAEGLNAPLPPVTRRTRCIQFLRERAARLAMAVDLIAHRNPAHLGRKQPLPF